MSTKKKTERELVLNNNLSILHIDGVYTYHREDKINLVRLTTSLPDMISEQARFIVDDETLKIIIDDFCEIIEYYPKPPKKKERKSNSDKKAKQV
ncbi:MAG: hypothetical protein ACOWWR_17360 [Eubacteriales bacterium]